MNREVIALVPMKGHSERVKNKNMRLFCGAPLYRRIIDSLLDVSYVKKIIIDTDSDIIINDIKSNYKNNNCICILKRPDFLLGDFVVANSLIDYDIHSQYCSCDYILQTHATNPLLKTSTIKESIDVFFDNLECCDSLFSVTKLQTRLYDSNGKAVNHNAGELIRTQDLPPLFEENSCIYLFSKTSFANSNKRRIGLKPFLFEIPKLEAIDIDTEDDFIIAESIAEKEKRND